MQVTLRSTGTLLLFATTLSGCVDATCPKGSVSIDGNCTAVTTCPAGQDADGGTCVQGIESTTDAATDADARTDGEDASTRRNDADTDASMDASTETTAPVDDENESHIDLDASAASDDAAVIDAADSDNDNEVVVVPPEPDLCGDEPALEGACADNLEGVYAIKVELDVWWQDDATPPLTDPGRDLVTLYLRGEIQSLCDNGTDGDATVHVCGVELPTFKSDANCDAFQYEFPNALWDQPTMPTLAPRASATAFDTGNLLTVARETGLLGIALHAADVNDTWPPTADDVTCEAGSIDDCFPDHDGDGNPGITVTMANVGMNLTQNGCGGYNQAFVYRGAPLDALGALVDEGVKAETLYVGMRVRVSGAGALGLTCNSGTAESYADFIDLRTIGCTKEAPMGQPDAGVQMPCTITDAQFVDASAPRYNILAKNGAPPTSVTRPQTQGGGPLDQTPSPGPRSALVRLGDVGTNVSCAQVRAASFPSF